MQATNNYPKIVTDESLMEKRSHGTALFPLQYYEEDIWSFDLHTVDWHWHPEIELVFVREGSVRCCIGSDEVELQAGMGLFVNHHVIHRFMADAPDLVPNVVFSTELLAPTDSLIDRMYIKPVLQGAGAYIVFLPDVEWHAEVLRLMNGVFDAQRPGAEKPIATLRCLLELWEMLHAHIDTANARGDADLTGNAARLQIMMRYIHEHYAEPITLDDVAASVFISKSSALSVFRQGIHTTPVAYLIGYRLKRAAALLTSTQKPVTDIAEATGFQSSGYFCRKFRELFGMTPAEYRRRKRDEGANA